MMKHNHPKRKYWVHSGHDVGPHPHPIPKGDEFVQTNVAIRASDGTTLRGDLYIPQGQGPFPAVVEISPYGSQRSANLGVMYAARGYLFLAVDCRGRYRSEGEWDPLTYDRQDGHDVLKWIAEHQLCNGSVGTRGHSYSGYNQLLAAVDAPECLKAMVVGVAPGDPFTNAPYQGGCYDLNDLFWLLDMSGRVAAEDDRSESEEDLSDLTQTEDHSEELSEEEVLQNELIDAALTHQPFGDVDLSLGIYHPTFRKWVAHWKYDSFWKDRSVLPGIPKTNVPTLHISGWWDGNGRGSTQFFEAMRSQAKTEEARENQRLLMGPWNHDLQAPDCEALPANDKLFIERGALRDSLNDELDWFDRFLKGTPSSPGTDSRVSLYLTGANKWVDFSDWPVPATTETSLYLDSAGVTGALKNNPPSMTTQKSYLFDPKDPTPFAEADVDAERIPFDNATIQEEREDILIFDTQPYESKVGIVGPVTAKIYASSDTLDFDLNASIYDVFPDGRSIYLTDGVIRARFREGFESPKLVEPGKVCEYTIDLWHVGHVFRPGHKLRLQIASGALFRFDVNPCTGGDLATDTGSKTATITIHQGKEYPSCLCVYSMNAESL